jgi:acyl-CoA-binding protein
MGKFEDIVNIVSNSNETNNLPDNIKLNFYKFYKQATKGDCMIDKPSFYYFEAISKWNAWNSIKGMSKDEAKDNYINLYESIVKN